MPNPFKPTAGATPPLLVGRDQLIDEFRESLDDGPGAPGLLTLVTGARGTGKTVMLTEMGEAARTQGWVVIDETARDGLMDRLRSQIDGCLAALDSPQRSRWTSLSVTTPLGGGGITLDRPPRESRSWRSSASALTARLAENETGLLITVDEIHAIPRAELQALAAEVQHLIRDRAPIGLIMAGLPRAVEDLLNDEITTFLRRAERLTLGEVPLDEVQSAFQSTFSTAGRPLSEELAHDCALATEGYPFMIQLVGYHVWRRCPEEVVVPDAVSAGIAAARSRLGDLVHAPALQDLSDTDRSMLVSMAEDDGPSRIADVATRMGQTSGYVSVYRARLIAAGMIRPAGYGLVDFAAPYLREYLRTHSSSLSPAPRAW